MMSNAARAFLGVPWKHQGRTRLGIDCIGLVVACLRECGHVPPDRTDYGRDPNGELVAALVANCTPVPMQEGAIALVRYGPELRHVGIIGRGHDGLTLIHADSHQRRVVEHPIDARWRKRIVSCWEYVGKPSIGEAIGGVVGFVIPFYVAGPLGAPVAWMGADAPGEWVDPTHVEELPGASA